MIRTVPVALCVALLLPALSAQITIQETLNVGTFNALNPGDHAADNAHLYVIQPSQFTDTVAVGVTITSTSVGFVLPFISFATGPFGYETQDFLTISSTLGITPITLPALVSFDFDNHLFAPNPFSVDPIFQAAFAFATSNIPGQPFVLPPLDIATLLNLPLGLSDADAVYFQGARLDALPNGDVTATFSDGITVARVEPFGITQDAPPSTPDFAYFGAAMTTADLTGDGIDELIVGAPGFGTPSVPSSGRVFIYVGTPNGLHPVPYSVSEPSMLAVLFPNASTPAPIGFLAGPAPYAEFGASLATGDLDNDGLLDLVVGAPGAAATNAVAAFEPAAGEVYVIRGSILAAQLSQPLPGSETPLTLNQTGATTDFFALSTFRAGGRAGTALAVGDANGDGIDDLVVSAPFEDDDASAAPSVSVDAGRVFAFIGPMVPVVQNFVDASFDFFPQGSTDRLFFGQSLAFANLNGMGGDELIVGAPGREVAGLAGAGEVTSWSVDGVVAQQVSTFFVNTPALNAGLGQSVAAGDFDNDGQIEVVAGSNEAVDSVAEVGAVYFWVNGSGLPPERILPTNQANVRRFGYSLLAKDLNDDGVTDLAVGAPGSTIGSQVSIGAAMVYFGNQRAGIALDEPLRRLFLTGPGSNALDSFGIALAAGDFDGAKIGTPSLNSLMVGASLGAETGRMFFFEDLLSRVPQNGLINP